jgi:carboxypeptidase Q
MTRKYGAAFLLIFVWAVVGAAQTAPADPVLLSIKQAATEGSRVAEYLFQLTDAVGPRVVGSPALRKSEVWLADRLGEYGLHSVRTETNPPIDVGGGIFLDPPGWSWSRLTVQQLAPWQQTLIAVPVLYSPSTPGAVAGDVVVAPLPRPSESDVTAFMSRYKGRVRAKFLLLSDKESTIVVADAPASRRYTASELKDMSEAKPIASPGAPPPRATSEPPSPAPRMSDVLAQHSRLFDFLREEGVLGLVGPARPGSQGGTLIVNAPAAPPTLTSSPPPMIDLAPEHFNRILRLAQRAIPVRLEVNLASSVHEPAGIANVIGEIPGGDGSQEVVIVGAHLDSWHGGTGATDNAAGVAAVLEAVRTLTTLRVPLRRTVQIAFWGGEELGRVGSRGYVQRYLLHADGTPTEAARRVSAYLNLDYGSGRIRGIYLQGNEALKPLFDEWLIGVGDGGLVATLRSTLGSDQATFERIGAPGLSFIQDPLNYEQRTHHTTMDVSDYVVVDDVKDSAATLASVIYRIANADALLPRKSMR